MSDIPSGYMLSVVSWENDADNYFTKTLVGLTREDVNFYLTFLAPFRASYRGGLYGNQKIDKFPEAEYDAMKFAFEESPPSSPNLLEEIGAALKRECDPELTVELIGPSWGGWEYYRVFDSFQVNLVPVQCADVTNLFQKTELNNV